VSKRACVLLDEARIFITTALTNADDAVSAAWNDRVPLALDEQRRNARRTAELVAGIKTQDQFSSSLVCCNIVYYKDRTKA